MSKRNPIFFKYRGITIYRTYHERYEDILNEYWYSTSPTRHARYQFDVRELKEFSGEHRFDIQEAIDNDTLPVSVLKVRTSRTINACELNGILCGLRLVQRDGYLGAFGKVSALTDKQIDKLCETLNTAKAIVLK